jgi:hypothetical protein
MSLLNILIVISSVSFLYYGISFFIGTDMQNEFERFKLKNFLQLIGSLQLLGGIGLLVGLKYAVILSISSLGLAVLMLIGFIIRMKIKDGLLVSIPSFFFMILNFYIFIESLKRF